MKSQAEDKSNNTQAATELSFFDQYGLISESGYFDPEFYSAKYLERLESKSDPVLHYLEQGAAKGNKPSLKFDPAYYMNQCAQRGIKVENPLLHYLLHGQYLDLRTSRFGKLQPRNDSKTIDHIVSSGLFDRNFYNATYSEDFATDHEAVAHYFHVGFGQGRKPNFYFDSAWYLKKYPDVRSAGLQPLTHYIAHGDPQGLLPSLWFDSSWYRKEYKIPGGTNALAHYLTKRKTGLFSPLPDFDVEYYTKFNSDLIDAGIDPFEHFLLAGCSEGRVASSKYSARYYIAKYIGDEVLAKSRMSSGLVGYIERVEAGDGFAVLVGWVAAEKADEQATGPISISVQGQTFGPVKLEFRQDIADAGIAAGRAGFKVTVPIGGISEGRVVDIRISDAARNYIRLFCPGLRVSAFAPIGMIEEVGPEGITGWVFDPRLSIYQRKPILRYDDDYDELVDLDILRTDPRIQDLVRPEAGQRFGFRKEASSILTHLRKAGQPEKSAVTIKLISSGVVLWTHTVPLRGGQVTGAPKENITNKLKPEPVAQTDLKPIVGKASSLPDGVKPRMLVVSWDMGHNPVGRAYLLADIARIYYDVKLIGPQFQQYGTALWGPLRGQTNLPIDIFPGGLIPEYLATLLKVVEKNPADVVYVSKPRLPSLIFGFLMQLKYGCALVVDSDDHELSFFKNDTPLSISQAIQAAIADPNGTSMPHSEVWTRLGEHLLQYAGAVTVSNIALQKKFGGTIVRHARDENTFFVSSQQRKAIRHEFGLRDDQVAVVFLGTPRPHKGIYKVAAALEAINDPRLVFVIVGTITDARTRNKLAQYKRANIRFFENQPWSRLHEIVAMADIVPVLQVAEDRIADFQIPAKLTDAIALNVPVVATRVPPLEDFRDLGAFHWVDSDDDLEKVFRSRLASSKALEVEVEKGRDLYLKEFTYAENAKRIKSVVEQARQKTIPSEIKQTLVALYNYAKVPFPLEDVSLKKVTANKPRKFRKGPPDLVFFWKQNDTDLYGRRSDMMIKYLLESGKVRKILQLDRPLTLQQMNTVVDQGKFASYHEGNLVYLNTTRRLLRLADTARVAKRTFLHRMGTQPQTFFGQDLPPKEAYSEFVENALKECGMDPHPMAWVCPVVFDFPELHEKIGFGKIVVDIIDDQRKWKSQESYLRRVEKNYEDVLKLGDLVLCNCEPVREGFRELRSDILVVPNGAEPFPKERKWSLPEDLAELPRPIVGYVGNLRDRVDIAAIREMAEKRPKWSVVLIGSAGGSLDVLALSELPNIHLLGVKPYEQALHYIKHFDVAIMPHIKNAISENMNPLKLYVYFALGVPIVTTNVSNIGEIGPHVSIVDTTRQFIKAIEANLNGKGPKVSARARMASLNKVSWKSRVDKVISQLKL